MAHGVDSGNVHLLRKKTKKRKKKKESHRESRIRWNHPRRPIDPI